MKTITFKYNEYVKDNECCLLGVPESVEVIKGHYRDGGVHLKFETSELSIGIKEKFVLALFAEDINEITEKIWKKYMESEPERANEDLKKMIKKLQNF